ncbi:hypothetical protein [Nocardiopsis halophila]|uniref:hypothetical protein n=1 Tax=Nocardiopsis halophila TaxID=141692 RepID=UPI00126820F4|nr:hypothetical protein [Nocardiopsis halophila]
MTPPLGSGERGRRLRTVSTRPSLPPDVHALPAHWVFGRVSTDEASEPLRTTDSARWCYPEVAHSEKHNIGLIEREYEDLQIFS